MLGRTTFVIFTVLLIAVVAAMAALPALADEVYSLDKDFARVDSNIVIHLEYVSVTDKYMGNIYPSASPEETKWAHLVYQYENTGDVTEVGHIQYELIDTRGRVYRFNPNLDEYSGAEVRPHSKSDVRWNEIPIPKDAVLAQVHVFEGTNPELLLANATYDLRPPAMSSPGTVPAGPSPEASPAPRYPCCAPLLPFALLGGLGVVGLYVKGKGIKK